jgi:hypothetical protein
MKMAFFYKKAEPVSVISTCPVVRNYFSACDFTFAQDHARSCVWRYDHASPLSALDLAACRQDI